MEEEVLRWGDGYRGEWFDVGGGGRVLGLTGANARRFIYVISH